MSDLWSIPRAARSIGVTPPALRKWIKDGLVPQPSILTASGESAYETHVLEEITEWYAERVSTHSTRGPGAEERRASAEDRLNRQLGGPQ